MSAPDVTAAFGAEFVAEMAEMADAVLAGTAPARAQVISELTTVIAERCEVVDAHIDGDGAELVLSNGARLRCDLDRALVGLLVDPALRFRLDAFWEESEGGWTLGWETADGATFLQTTVRRPCVLRDENDPI
jgi:hypothetical protein